MNISTKELRIQPGRIISQVSHGMEMTVTYRGKPLAKIVPIRGKKNYRKPKDEAGLFGLWKGHRGKRTSVEEQVRELRKGRQL
ncbi:MAG: type II toxin-antitoxin system prevent-host-death family antitoxin [Chitinivibrionales bacterium]|nr:type II toxin-antitoxin system prevent-host-death family antitoxin [Chitinivibrionales bacterium]